MKINDDKNEYLKKYSTKLRNNSTLSEALLWIQLKNSKLGVRFTRQKIIGNYIVDFYCPCLKTVIEIDGSTHDFVYKQDRLRDKYFVSKGLQVVRILDIDVKKNMDGVVIYLEKYIEMRLL
jgi:very-short-patch-repair endonuclease